MNLFGRVAIAILIGVAVLFVMVVFGSPYVGTWPDQAIHRVFIVGWIAAMALKISNDNPEVAQSQPSSLE